MASCMEPDLERLLTSAQLAYHAPDRVIICTLCQYALQPGGQQVSRHLAIGHGCSASLRRQLVPLVNALGLPSPLDLPLRPDGSEPIPGLAIIDGVGCGQCSFRTTSSGQLARHLSQQHPVQKGSGEAKEDAALSGLRLQSWTQYGRRGYWVVQDPPPPFVHVEDSWSTFRPSPAVFERIRNLQDEEQLWIAHTRGIVDDIRSDTAIQRPWIRRTGWVRTYGTCRRDILVRLAGSPQQSSYRHQREAYSLGEVNGVALVSSAADEQRLVAVSRAFDLFFARCEETVRSTNTQTLRWIHGQRRAQPAARPFSLVSRTASATKYYRLWKRVTFFWLRFWRLGDAGGQLFQRIITPRADALLRRIWDAADPSQDAGAWCDTLPTVDDEHDWSDDSDSDMEGSTLEESDPEETSILSKPIDGLGSATGCVSSAYEAALPDYLAQWSVSLLQEEYYDGNAASTLLIYAAGVFGLTDEGRTL